MQFYIALILTVFADIVVTSGIYGDINRVPTTGASRRTAQQDRLTYSVPQLRFCKVLYEHLGFFFVSCKLRGRVQASKKMAANDLDKINRYKATILSVAKNTNMDGAVIAGIISRESRGGSALKNGWGDHNNAFGAMQVDKRYHTIRGTWNSAEHITQGVQILIGFYNTMKNKFPKASKEMLLKGAIAAYNTGPGRVKDLNNVDAYTTGGDYGNDVAGRAQFFRSQGY